MQNCLTVAFLFAKIYRYANYDLDQTIINKILLFFGEYKWIAMH